MTESASVKATVYGRVKGIGFRAFVLAHAKALGLTGYVLNLPDEPAVMVEAEGDKVRLEKLITYLRTGPAQAGVERLEVGWLEYTGKYLEFSIRR